MSDFRYRWPDIARDVDPDRWLDLAERAILAGDLSPASCAAALFDVWARTGLTLPLRARPLPVWLDLYAALGGVFAVDERLSEPDRPRAPLTLYRGARDAHRAGLSWTPSRHFAERYAELRSGRIWGAVVPPAAMLAAVRVERRAFWHEILIDPRGLDPRPVPPPAPSDWDADREALRLARSGASDARASTS